MKQLMKILLVCGLSLMVFAGCGKEPTKEPTNGSGSVSESEPVSESESLNESEPLSENSAPIHSIFLKSDGETWLFASDTAGLFTAPVPDDLTDASGAAIEKDQLVPGNQIDIYGNGIMLESYPGQYPGVVKMVVTGQGAEADLEPYQEEIDMFFPEPDLSEPPELSISYNTSMAAVTALLTGPVNYTWEAPDPLENGESTAVAACGPHITQCKELADMTLEGRTEVQFTGSPLPEQIKVVRWPSSVYMAEDDIGEGEVVDVTKDENGRFVITVEAGYIYGAIAEWEMGQADYGFITKAIEK